MRNGHAEELSDLGLLKADLLSGWMAEAGITAKLDAVYALHMQCTAQTIEPTAKFAPEVMNDTQFSKGGEELSPESTSASICPTVAAILGSPPGSTLLVSVHTITLYKILDSRNCDDCAGLGLYKSDLPLFPKDDKGEDPEKSVWRLMVCGYQTGMA